MRFLSKRKATNCGSPPCSTDIGHILSKTSKKTPALYNRERRDRKTEKAGKQTADNHTTGLLPFSRKETKQTTLGSHDWLALLKQNTHKSAQLLESKTPGERKSREEIDMARGAYQSASPRSGLGRGGTLVGLQRTSLFLPLPSGPMGSYLSARGSALGAGGAPLMLFGSASQAKARSDGKRRRTRRLLRS